METNKMNKKLVTEIEQMKLWMKFLGNQTNYNKSFYKPTANNPKLITETFQDNPNDRFGTPEKSSDELILGNTTNTEDMVHDGSFIVISTDINGGIHVTMVEAEDENAAIDQTENEMIIQSMVITEDALMELISKLSQYLPEDLTTGEESDKPPFIDEPAEDIIDEDLFNGLAETRLILGNKFNRSRK